MKIPVTWELSGYVEINVETVGEAIEHFNLNSEYIRLPEKAEYVYGSFRLVTEDIDEMKAMIESIEGKDVKSGSAAKEIPEFVIRKLRGFAAASKRFYENGNLDKAAHYWCRMYDLVTRHKIPLDIYMPITETFTDQQVYDITDRIKDKFYYK